jgi:hypothetical protein
MANGAHAQPLIASFGWRLFVALLPLIGTIVFRLMEIPRDPTNQHAHFAELKPEFWNLSFDILFTAMGIYFGSILFVKEVENKKTAAQVGVVLFSLFFAVVIVNMILAHAFWPFTDPVWRLIIADMVALISLSLAVYVN